MCHCGGIPPARKAKAAHHATTAAHVKRLQTVANETVSKIKYCGASARPLRMRGATRTATPRLRLCPSDMCLCDDKPPPPGRAYPSRITPTIPPPTSARGHTHHSAAYKRKHLAEVRRTTTPGLSRQSHRRTSTTAPLRPRTPASGSHRPAPWAVRSDDSNHGQPAAMHLPPARLDAAYYAKAASERMGGLPAHRARGRPFWAT